MALGLAGVLEGEGWRTGVAVFDGETERCAASDAVFAAIGFAGDFAGLGFGTPELTGDLAGVFADGFAGDCAGAGFAGDSASAFPDLEGDVDLALSGVP